MNKQNYELETQRIIDGLQGQKPSLLLHVCCAPCASASLEFLTQHFSVTAYFYNPNITDAAEYQKRLDELRRFVLECPLASPVTVLEGGYDPTEFAQAARGQENEPEGGLRCTACFSLRLGKTVQAAQQGGYDYCATTLTISPLKDAVRINRIGSELCQGTTVKWLPTDLKKKGRYQRSIALSKEYGLYRQSFCGCEFSRQQAERREQHT